MLKSQLRRQLLHQRQSLPREVWQEKSHRLRLHLQSSPLFQQATTILAYCSFRQEPNLRPLFKDSGKTWGLPRCVGKSLVWHPYQPGDSLIKGAYGILEPDPDSPTLSLQDVDLILVPAVACDRRGYRLGYGGGFYDRLFSQNSSLGNATPRLGIIFDFAFLSQIPLDPWDQPLTGICTESKLYNKFPLNIVED